VAASASWPTSIAAWITAPSATTSSTLTPARGGRAHHLGHVRPDHRHPRRAPHEQDAVQVAPRPLRLAERLLGQAAGPVHQREGHGLELGAGQLVAAPLRPELEGDPRRGPLGEQPLRLLAADEHLVERDRVVEGIDPGVGGELLGEEGGDPVVPVLAAEVVVARRGQDGELVGRDAGDGHVEGAAAEVVDEHGLRRARTSAGRRPARRRSAR